MTRPTLIIAGGGTGGHVFPALAVAEAMQALADVDVVFFGTPRGLESRVVPERGFRLEYLNVEPIKGRGLAHGLRGGVVALRATLRSFAVVRSLEPRAVLSVGGYAAGPVSLAAALRGVPVAVLEPNSAAGFSNRLLAPAARRAYIAWEGASRAFRAGSVRRYGVPLRPGFMPVPYRARGTARVLVMGGSQGSAALNSRLPAALARLERDGLDIEVVHQAGRDRDASVRAAYAREGVTRALVVPFIGDVGQAIGDADLIVARAGAVTVAEITAIGRASILIPFPNATDDHQGKNAEELERMKAAVCLRQPGASPARLAAEMGHLLADDAAREAMANAARNLGRPHAAFDVAADFIALASIATNDFGSHGGSGGPRRLVDAPDASFRVRRAG